MKKNLLVSLPRPLILFLIVSAFPVLLVNSQSINNYSDTNFDGYSDETSHLLIKPSSDVNFNPADTGDVVHSVPTPGPNTQALTWDGSNLWCGDISSKIIYKINPVDGNVVHSFDFPGELVEGLAWDGTHLWCSDNDSDVLYKFDPEDGSIISELQFSNVWIHGITWDGEYLWLNDFQDKVILKINSETGEILHSIPTPGTGSIGLTWDGIHLWADDFNTDKLYCLNPIDGAIIYEVDAPSTNPRDLAWDGQYLWVLSAITSTIYQVDVGSITNVEEISQMPDAILSLLVYPNPFVDELNIEFVVNRSSMINVEIYDQTGNLIQRLITDKYSPGKHVVKWDGKGASKINLSNGIYYCELRSGVQKISRKIVVAVRN